MTDQQPPAQPMPQVPQNQVPPQGQVPQNLYTPQQPVGKSTSGMSVTALVLGIVSIAFSFIPIINNAAIILGVIGLVFGIIAIVKTGKNGKKTGSGIAIAGTILAIVAVIISFALQASWSASLDDASKQMDKISKDIDAQTDGKTSAKSVKLEATSAAQGDVMWGTMSGSTSDDEFGTTWSKTLSGKDAQKVYSVTVTNANYDNPSSSDKVSCTITVDGKKAVHQEATGKSASVTCSQEDK
jgi:hypothetical protein